MRAFIIRGFGVKKDSEEREINFDEVESKLIRPAMTLCALSGGTTATYEDSGSIHADMFGEILRADVVVCDITVHNANVFYELGIRHALRKKRTVLIKGDPSADSTPFDIAGGRYLKYPLADPGSQVDALAAAIKASIETARETDSPIFQILPTLTEANPADVRVVPMDFIEEVQLAQAAQDKGWLRLLAEEVRGETFQWDGLLAIAQAQWRVKDYAGARDNWEAIRTSRPNDVKANLALANVYERLYRDERRPALLEASNLAIERLLALEKLSATDRAEALALNGRNLKTLWRLDFEELPTLHERRERALGERLRRSYEAYRAAFEADLNNFYPGLAALQAGFILEHLSTDADWASLFLFDTEAADRYLADLKRQLAALEAVVAASIDATRKRLLPKVDPWAEISLVDQRFIAVPETLFEHDAKAFVKSYLGVVPMEDAFARDAVCGQLELFAALGIREPGARAVIEHLKPPKPPKLHLVVVSGHSVDAADAVSERFPPRLENAAKAALAERIRSLQSKEYKMLVLASAAPGTD
ncbi:MAG: tetratricopeptide repeat-containing protein, partial [Leptothrix sp. (in: b-proteobacteria)]